MTLCGAVTFMAMRERRVFVIEAVKFVGFAVKESVVLLNKKPANLKSIDLEEGLHLAQLRVFVKT